jgi:hypothetical protein
MVRVICKWLKKNFANGNLFQNMRITKLRSNVEVDYEFANLNLVTVKKLRGHGWLTFYQ